MSFDDECWDKSWLPLISPALLTWDVFEYQFGIASTEFVATANFTRFGGTRCRIDGLSYWSGYDLG